MKKITHLNVKDVKRIMDMKRGSDRLLIARLFKDEHFPEYRGFDEPLPDVIGFKQHLGECASDAIQESFLFADGIREYTQPILYGMTETQIDVRTKLSLKYFDWDRFTAYFEFVQKRFKSTYDVLNYIRTHKIKPQDYQHKKDEVCALDPIFDRKRVVSPEAGVLALKRITRQEEYKVPGLTSALGLHVMDSVIKWFGIPFEAVKWKDVKRENLVSILVSLQNGLTTPAGDIHWTSTFHATAIFKMLNKTYYYDNEGGFYPMSDSLVNEFLDPANQCYVFFKTGLYFKPIFFKGGTYPTHVWVPSKGWDSDIASVTIEHPAVKGLRIYSREGFIQRAEVDKFLAIQRKPSEKPYNMKLCKIVPAGPAPDEDTAVVNVKKLIDCIYENKLSNSSIFEDLYHYVYENLALLHKDPDTLARVTSTLSGILKQPVCSPLIHYWVWKLQSAIFKKYPDEIHEWFVMPTEFVIEHMNRPNFKITPVEEKEKKMAEIIKLLAEEALAKGDAVEEKENKPPTPCKAGQIRDRHTRKCRDKTKEELEAEKARKEERVAKKEEMKARGESPVKKVKRTPCPPGQVRNAKTKKCKPRHEALPPCPPGQIRDRKTKKCREIVHVKL